MQRPAGRTGLGSAQGRGRVIVLSTALYSLISVTAASYTPQIINPKNDSIINKKDEGLTISCSANTTFEKFHNVYWLVNGTFVEDVYPDGRVTEKTGKVTPGKSKRHFTVVQTLEFTRTQAEDFTNTFTCVVQDPAGADKKRFKLKADDEKHVRIMLIKNRKQRDRDIH
ncbi:interleukin-1 receptor-like 2 [Hyla sarda]|uniref:interleukin-1 receptor-like 2 n=1 Tax=Hyla sarda TaxID=327740 RepID=UPI0024C43896|nr:interleukin-1 receptor-like 2 [Hyla sarda]